MSIDQEKREWAQYQELDRALGRFATWFEEFILNVRQYLETIEARLTRLEKEMPK